MLQDILLLPRMPTMFSFLSTCSQQRYMKSHKCCLIKIKIEVLECKRNDCVLEDTWILCQYSDILSEMIFSRLTSYMLKMLQPHYTALQIGNKCEESNSDKRMLQLLHQGQPTAVVVGFLLACTY